MSKFKYEDLQPHIEMLIDAIENRGASSSGIPDIDVYEYAPKYRKLLAEVRNKQISYDTMKHLLSIFEAEILQKTKQVNRVQKICQALDFYFTKEYNKQ